MNMVYSRNTSELNRGKHTHIYTQPIRIGHRNNYFQRSWLSPSIFKTVNHVFTGQIFLKRPNQIN